MKYGKKANNKPLNYKIKERTFKTYALLFISLNYGADYGNDFGYAR